MDIEVEKIIGWEHVLDSARTTVGKEDRNKEPSDEFKKSILVSEHSPIRNLTFEIIFHDIPYWVAMHFRTHHIGFKSGADDLYFIQTQRTDRTQVQRDELPQNATVRMRVIANAQSIINLSRVRLCRMAMFETRIAWELAVCEISKVESILADLCQPNCVYRGICPEGKNCCGWNKTMHYTAALEKYRKICMPS